MKTLNILILAAVIGVVSIPFVSKAVSGGGDTIRVARAQNHCDFWLVQKGDPTLLAIKHSYCVRRGGY